MVTRRSFIEGASMAALTAMTCETFAA